MPIEKEKVNRFKYWVIGMVNGIAAKDLFAMIKNNDVPLPFELELPTYFSWVKDAVIEYKQDILDQLTFESAMKYSGEFRPDLKVILQHARGREWLNRFLKVIRFMIENIELSAHEMKVKFLKKAQKIQAERNAIFKAERQLEENVIKEEADRQAQIATQEELLRVEQSEKLQLEALNNLADTKIETPPLRTERKYSDNPLYDIY